MALVYANGRLDPYRPAVYSERPMLSEARATLADLQGRLSALRGFL